jgi:osmotically-inducible protein OsmY
MQAKLHSQVDNDLRDSVVQQLEWDPRIVSQDIAVTVRDGAVSLAGLVHSYFQKVIAARVATSVYGVKAVANDIEVASSRTDPEIARDIVEAMKTNMSVPDNLIKATIINGAVTLEGTVEWRSQREAAASCVSKVNGVRTISNDILLKAPISIAEVKAKIENALTPECGIGSPASVFLLRVEP